MSGSQNHGQKSPYSNISEFGLVGGGNEYHGGGQQRGQDMKYMGDTGMASGMHSGFRFNSGPQNFGDESNNGHGLVGGSQSSMYGGLVGGGDGVRNNRTMLSPYESIEDRGSSQSYSPRARLSSSNSLSSTGSVSSQNSINGRGMQRSAHPYIPAGMESFRVYKPQSFLGKSNMDGGDSDGGFLDGGSRAHGAGVPAYDQSMPRDWMFTVQSDGSDHNHHRDNYSYPRDNGRTSHGVGGIGGDERIGGGSMHDFAWNDFLDNHKPNHSNGNEDTTKLWGSMFPNNP